MKSFLLSFFFNRRMSFRGLFKFSKMHPYSMEISRVAAIRMNFRTFKSARDFYKYILSTVKKAKKKGAQLICFPQGTDLELQPIPMKKMSDSQRKKVLEIHTNIFRNIASHQNVYIEESKIRNGKFEANIWDPQGNRLSDKIVKCGGEKIYFSRYDSEFDENIGEDVKLYLFPRFGSSVKKTHEISKAWLASQQNYVFSVESKLVGRCFNTTLRGRAGIYAPLEMTDFGDGILALSHETNEDEIVVANLEFDKIRRLSETMEDDVYKRLLL